MEFVIDKVGNPNSDSEDQDSSNNNAHNNNNDNNNDNKNNKKRKLDEVSGEDVEDSESDNDASEEDTPAIVQMKNRYYLDPNEGKKCFTCGKMGHMKFDCPNAPPCPICGQKGHPQCFYMTCFNCFRIGHHKSDCPYPKYRMYCKRCDLDGHSEDTCQEIWRDYKYIDDDSKSLGDSSSSSSDKEISTKKGKMTSKKIKSGNYNSNSKKQKKNIGSSDLIVFCYNCAASDHCGDECRQSKTSSSRTADQYSFSCQATVRYLQSTRYMGKLLSRISGSPISSQPPPGIQWSNKDGDYGRRSDRDDRSSSKNNSYNNNNKNEDSSRKDKRKRGGDYTSDEDGRSKYYNYSNNNRRGPTSSYDQTRSSVDLPRTVYNNNSNNNNMPQPFYSYSQPPQLPYAPPQFMPPAIPAAQMMPYGQQMIPMYNPPNPASFAFNGPPPANYNSSNWATFTAGTSYPNNDGNSRNNTPQNNYGNNNNNDRRDGNNNRRRNQNNNNNRSGSGSGKGFSYSDRDRYNGGGGNKRNRR